MTTRIRLGAICWLGTLVFLVGQFAAQAAWPAYAIAANDISLLGVTSCGLYLNPAPDGIMPVCSPLHLAFNAGMAINGVLVALGVWFTRRAFPLRRLTSVARWLLGIGGVGSLMAGLFPLDVYFPLHATGAVLALFVADFGFFCLAGALWRRHRGFALYCLLTGLVTLAGFLAYVTDHDLGLGRGIVERIAAWPHTLWYVTTGFLLLAGRLSAVEPAQTTGRADVPGRNPKKPD